MLKNNENKNYSFNFTYFFLHSFTNELRVFNYNCFNVLKLIKQLL